MKWSKHYKASLLTLTNVCCIRKLCRLFISRSEVAASCSLWILLSMMKHNVEPCSHSSFEDYTDL